MITTLDILKNAKKSAPDLLMASTEEKNKALLLMAEALINNTEKIPFYQENIETSNLNSIKYFYIKNELSVLNFFV